MHEINEIPSSKTGGRIAIVGNPNVGKSVIFGALTRKSVNVSNYPGTTVEVISGETRIHSREFQVLDMPGTNSFVPMSEDEEVTRDMFLNENFTAVVQVIDSKNLNRGLMITLQLIEMGLPLVTVLNMQDEIAARGLSINKKRLEEKTAQKYL